MSSKVPSPSSGYYLTPEECQEMFRGFTPGQFDDADIPDHHKEILEERIIDYCKNGVYMTPWEEFEKELDEILMKG